MGKKGVKRAKNNKKSQEIIKNWVKILCKQMINTENLLKITKKRQKLLKNFKTK